METLVRDIRHGTRSLLGSKGFTATVLLTFGLCVGANTTIFAIVHSVLLRPLPVPDADAIVLMSNRYPRSGAGELQTSSSGDYFDRLRAVTALQQQALFRIAEQVLDAKGTPEQVTGMAVTPSLFPMLGIPPMRGRTFAPEEGETGLEQKVVLSHSLWRQLYNGDPSAIGRQLRLGGRPFTIVGVMPPHFVSSILMFASGFLWRLPLSKSPAITATTSIMQVGLHLDRALRKSSRRSMP